MISGESIWVERHSGGKFLDPLGFCLTEWKCLRSVEKYVSTERGDNAQREAVT